MINKLRLLLMIGIMCYVEYDNIKEDRLILLVMVYFIDFFFMLLELIVNVIDVLNKGLYV